MRNLLLCSVAALLAAACSDATPPAVATSVSVSPASISFDAVGATQVVRAVVSDQNGKPMPGAAISWGSGSAAVSVTGAAGDSAILVSAAGGSASVTATSGSASGAVAVQVTQVATLLEKSAEPSTGAAGLPLPAPIRIQVLDRLRAGVPGVSVSFVAATGSGSVSAGSVVSGADGSATVGWTLGPLAGGIQQVTASAGTAAPVVFSILAVAGPPAAAAATAGDQQVAVRGAAVSVAPRVRVTDGFGNPVRDVAVQFSVTAGGGSVAGGAQTTDQQGTASVTSWTMGAAAGPNALTATFPGTQLPPVVFTATASDAVILTAASGVNQAAMSGTSVPAAPAVLVRDGSGNPLAGVTVDFTIGAGDGTVTGASPVTDGNGVATVSGWVLGSVAQPNTLTATPRGLAGDPVVFRAVGCSGGGGTGFALTLCFTTSVTPSQRDAYEAAAVRWAEIIRGDLPGLTVSVPAGSCGAGSPALDMPIDDLLIFAGIENIDGPGGILGQAGWCYRRTGGMPIVGLMRFDAADVAGLQASGRFVDVVLHEMGHVLGLSASLWNSLGLLRNPSTAGSQLDTYFQGPGAIAAFDAIGGGSYTGGQKVPVENSGGAGTMNSHWRESVLTSELMTGYLNQGVNPLSVVTVAALADMGYVVDMSAADPFSLILSLRKEPGTVIRLHDDEYDGPQWEIDRDGRRRRVR